MAFSWSYSALCLQEAEAGPVWLREKVLWDSEADRGHVWKRDLEAGCGLAGTNHHIIFASIAETLSYHWRVDLNFKMKMLFSFRRQHIPLKTASWQRPWSTLGSTMPSSSTFRRWTGCEERRWRRALHPHQLGWRAAEEKWVLICPSARRLRPRRWSLLSLRLMKSKHLWTSRQRAKVPTELDTTAQQRVQVNLLPPLTARWEKTLLLKMELQFEFIFPSGATWIGKF